MSPKKSIATNNEGWAVYLQMVAKTLIDGNIQDANYNGYHRAFHISIAYLPAAKLRIS